MNTRLVVGAEAGDVNTVKAALGAGASPDAMGPNSGALHVAAFGGHEAVVELLLAYGANPNLADKQSYFPLQLAASKNRTTVMRLLIKQGAALEATTKHGGTALHVAAASGHADALALLLKSGAKLEAEDDVYNTPLASALSLGQASAGRLLFEAKANIHARNETKATMLIHLARGIKAVRVPKWQATVEGLPETYRIQNGLFTVTSAGTSVVPSVADQRSYAAQDWGNARHIAYLDACDLFIDLVQAGVDVNAVDQDGHSAFGLVCHSGESRLIRFLFAQGANTKTWHEKGVSPAHLVAGSGRLDGLQAFLEGMPGFDVNARDEFGWTPLHYLADIGGELQMAALLQDRGADKTLRSTKDRGGIQAGANPADIARHWKDHDMAAALEIV